MKQPTILFEGVERKVDRIAWHEDGSVMYVCVYDTAGEYQTIFQSDEFFKEGFEDEVWHLDLDNLLKGGN